MRRFAVPPLLASVLIVTFAASGFGFEAAEAKTLESRPPCASAASKAPCHRAEQAPAPGDRCDPFRTSCAITCRLVGAHHAQAVTLGVSGARLRWDAMAMDPLPRPSTVPEPVPRLVAV